MNRAERRRRNRQGHEPIEPEVKTLMNRIAAVLDATFKPYGFCLLVFPFGEGDGRMNYISNAERPEMLTAIKEFIANCEGRVQTTETPQ